MNTNLPRFWFSRASIGLVLLVGLGWSQEACRTDLPCPARTFCSGESCLPCPAGTYSDSPTFEVSCTPCNVADETIAPNEGSISCEACPIGRFFRDVSLLCAPCPLGRTIPEDGDGTTGCIPCSEGSFEFNNTCVPCSAGKYAPSPGLARECLTCAAGKHSQGAAATECLGCDAGLFLNSSFKCEQCPSGTYSSEQDVAECTPCSPGRISPPSALVESDCVACPVGRFSGQGKCEACDARGIAADPGTSECAACRAGSVPNDARTLCTDCPADTRQEGGTCTPCESGSHSQAAATICCLKGTKAAFQFGSGSWRCVPDEAGIREGLADAEIEGGYYWASVALLPAAGVVIFCIIWACVIQDESDVSHGQAFLAALYVAGSVFDSVTDFYFGFATLGAPELQAAFDSDGTFDIDIIQQVSISTAAIGVIIACISTGLKTEQAVVNWGEKSTRLRVVSAVNALVEDIPQLAIQVIYYERLAAFNIEPDLVAVLNTVCSAVMFTARATCCCCAN